MIQSNQDLILKYKTWDEFKQNGERFYTGNIPKIFDIIDEQNIYNISEIADMLSVSKETVRRWCRQEKIRVFLPVGRYKVLGEDLRNFIFDWWRDDFIK